MHFRRNMAMAAACASASAFAPSGLPSSLSARNRPASVCTMVSPGASALCIWSQANGLTETSPPFPD